MPGQGSPAATRAANSPGVAVLAGAGAGAVAVAGHGEAGRSRSSSTLGTLYKNSNMHSVLPYADRHWQGFSRTYFRGGRPGLPVPELSFRGFAGAIDAARAEVTMSKGVDLIRFTHASPFGRCNDVAEPCTI